MLRNFSISNDSKNVQTYRQCSKEFSFRSTNVWGSFYRNMSFKLFTHHKCQKWLAWYRVLFKANSKKKKKVHLIKRDVAKAFETHSCAQHFSWINVTRLRCPLLCLYLSLSSWMSKQQKSINRESPEHSPIAIQSKFIYNLSTTRNTIQISKHRKRRKMEISDRYHLYPSEHKLLLCELRTDKKQTWCTAVSLLSTTFSAIVENNDEDRWNWCVVLVLSFARDPQGLILLRVRVFFFPSCDLWKVILRAFVERKLSHARKSSESSREQEIEKKIERKLFYAKARVSWNWTVCTLGDCLFAEIGDIHFLYRQLLLLFLKCIYTGFASLTQALATNGTWCTLRHSRKYGIMVFVCFSLLAEPFIFCLFYPAVCLVCDRLILYGKIDGSFFDRTIVNTVEFYAFVYRLDFMQMEFIHSSAL